MSGTPAHPTLRVTSRSLPIALLRARETVMAPYREMLGAAGISEQKWRVLRVLEETGPVEQTVIAEKACLLLASLTRILSAMEKDGLIGRETDVSDRRKTVVSLKEAGHQMILEYSGESTAITQKLQAAFGQDRFEALLDLLEALNGINLAQDRQDESMAG